MTVRLEELTPETVEKIFAFCGLKGAIPARGIVAHDRNPRRQPVNDTIRKACGEILGCATLEAFGYSLGYRPPLPETIQWPTWPRNENLLGALT